MTKEYSPAVDLMAAQLEARERLRERWKNDAGDLIDAHQFAFSAIASMIARFSGRRFERQSKLIEGRMSLTAQFVQGIDICETSISEGLYSQGSGVLKQELETLQRSMSSRTTNAKTARRQTLVTKSCGNLVRSTAILTTSPMSHGMILRSSS